VLNWHGILIKGAAFPKMEKSPDNYPSFRDKAVHFKKCETDSQFNQSTGSIISASASYRCRARQISLVKRGAPGCLGTWVPCIIA
jgi:hypothetical protein